MKSVHRKKHFLEVIQFGTKADILTLDTNIGKLESLRMMISNLTSTQYPNLTILLLVDEHFWSS